MERIKSSAIFQNKRIGFHYFPDTLHYRVKDLSTWLPHLTSLDASWVVLNAPADRAIPEHFIDGLLKNGIEPIIHFSFPPEIIKSPEGLDSLLYAYSRWGVKKAIFFDRPNLRSSWSAESWTKKNLIQQFITYFQPLANKAIRHGMTPVFPPLHPGGDYWDTVFLKTALEKMKQDDNPVISKLQLSSYVWTWEKPLNWGLGGSSNKIKARPYSSPDRPDQRGFRNYEWYQEIAKSTLGRSIAIHLLGAGLNLAPEYSKDPSYFANDLTNSCLNIFKVLSGEKLFEEEQPIGEIPSYVHSVNFWLLSADRDNQYYHQAWFQDEETVLPVVETIQDYLKQKQVQKKSLVGKKHSVMGEKTSNQFISPDTHQKMSQIEPGEQVSNGLLTKELEKLREKIKQSNPIIQPQNNEPIVQGEIPKVSKQTYVKDVPKEKPRNKIIKRPIRHYLLLPTYEWGVSDWHLDVIRPFVKKHQVTVGFSIREAVLAEKVTVIGNKQNFSDELLDKLRKSGCKVERISGDGTSIATQLKMR